MLDQVSKFLEYVKSVFAPGSEQVRAAEEAKKLWEHGNEAVENARGQIAISETDFEKIPDILSNYDNVSKSPNKNNQEQTRQ